MVAEGDLVVEAGRVDHVVEVWLECCYPAWKNVEHVGIDRGFLAQTQRFKKAIDLWNGRRLTDWLSYPRIQLGFSVEGTFSSYHDSREICFCRVL